MRRLVKAGAMRWFANHSPPTGAVLVLLELRAGFPERLSILPTLSTLAWRAPLRAAPVMVCLCAVVAASTSWLWLRVVLIREPRDDGGATDASCGCGVMRRVEDRTALCSAIFCDRTATAVLIFDG